MCNVGNKLYNRRKELGLTMDDVAAAVGVTKATVSKWEKGMIKNMGRDKIAAVCKVLQMSPTEICPAEWGEDEDEDVMELRQRLKDDPNYRILFKTAANVSKEDIMAAVRILKALKGDSDE